MNKQLQQSALYSAAWKSFPKNDDLDHYLDLLNTNPHEEWFSPSNSVQSENFTICERLANLNLIASRRNPQWKNGSLVAVKIYFYYSLDLKY